MSWLNNIFRSRSKRMSPQPLDNPHFVMDVIGHMVVPLFVLDRDGKVIIWNQACEQLTGVAAAQVVGTKDHWKGFYPAARPCLADLVLTGGGAKVGTLYAAHDKKNSNPERMKAENWCELPRGGRHYLAIDAGRIHDANGQLIAVVETLQNLTGLKEAEIAIQSERETQVNNLHTIRVALGKGLDSLASGDLETRVETPLPEAAEELRTNFNSAVHRLQELLVNIIKTSKTIHQGTAKISSSIEDLASHGEQQAAGINSTTAALDDITSMVRKTAEGVNQARDVVATAKSDAEKSGLIVGQAITAINEIEKSSKEIGQIVGMIDEIAFQTNLLALNAGVEAARAGDAGRGFAVVASEVRALAQRSAEAAKEIKGLISKSNTQVDHGVDLVAKAGSALERIVVQVSEINNVVSVIAGSSVKQVEALQRVNASMREVEQVTQRNVTIVEQSSDAAQSLSHVSSDMQEMIGCFNIGAIPVGNFRGGARPPLKVLATRRA